MKNTKFKFVVFLEKWPVRRRSKKIQINMICPQDFNYGMSQILLNLYGTKPELYRPKPRPNHNGKAQEIKQNWELSWYPHKHVHIVAYKTFKVIKGRRLSCHLKGNYDTLLLVINRNLGPISHRLATIARTNI